MTNTILLDSLRAGFPAKLVIGIAPPSASEIADAGKTPAIYTSQGWRPKKNWQEGFNTEQLRSVNLANGNLGLILGVVANDIQFIAVDLDTDGDSDPNSPQSLLAAQIYKSVIKTLTERLNKQTLWVRRTRPDRATILIALKPATDPGRIETIHFTHPDGIPAGKLQVLAHGQQTVIGGTHSYLGGTPIVWQEICEGEFVFEDRPFAPVSEIPVLPDRVAIEDLIEDVNFQLEVSLGLACSRRKTFSSLFRDSGEPLPVSEQAAWDFQSFIDLFTTMPHDERTSREEWVAIMIAASGAINAAKSLGLVNEVEVITMGNAVVDWSARWVGGTDYSSEQEKWDRDFSQINAKSVGWKYLIGRAVDYGDTKWCERSAQHEFGLLTIDQPEDQDFKDLLPSEPIDLTLYQEENNSYLTSVQTSRKNKQLRFDVKKSEIQIADYIEERLKGKCAWLHKEKKWIMWGGPEVSWTNPIADSLIKAEIQNQLVYYVTRYEEHFGNDDNARASLTSERSVSAMERLLRSRMTVYPDKVDKGDLCIQTPTGAWDLVTGKPFSAKELDRQVGFYDRRMTRVSPKQGPTPLFDSVLEHLACGDQEVIDWLWSYFGYALLGQPKLHLLLIIYGPGGNGKGTIANTLMNLWGDYAVSLDRRVIVQTGTNDHPTGTKRADGKRLWCVSELNPREVWNESSIKSMSGGDRISARAMNQDMGEFKPEGSFLIYTQFVPALHRVDESIIRRFRMLHARIKVPEELVNRTLEDKIFEQEGPAILYRLIQEAKAVVARDWELVKTPITMQAEVKRYFAGQDVYSMWWSETCQAVRSNGTDSDVAVDVLYDSYKRYVKKNNSEEETDDFLMDSSIDCMSLPAFTGALRRSGALLSDNFGRTIRGQGGKAMARGVRLKAIIGVIAA